VNGSWYLRRGRIGRGTYWLQYVLPMALAGLAAAVADLTLGLAWYSTSSVADGSSFGYSATYSGGPISLLVSLVLLVPSVSAAVTRLHDRGHSAWWLLWAFVPLVGGIVLLVTLGFLPGTPGRNRYDLDGHPARREPQLAHR
jgi:uncharacterized membrane protein YhaH (DUF805 family)